MDKKALLEYALFARKELETQIAVSLNKIGIYDDHVSYAHIVGDRTVIEGISESFDKRVYNLRKRIVDECLKDQKFSSVVEEFAYTWFNRIIAIRFMEVHDYFSHGFRVLTSRDGSYEPEILKNLPYVLDELNLDSEVIQLLKDQNKIEELYRYVLIKQCNALNPIFPELFDKQDSYLEFLLPNNLLGQDSVIRKINIIPEEDFLNDIEVVGWLYQYYVASNREEYRKAKKVTKEIIPTLSQIFTPGWIVRYMADNSVGRLWLESYPNSPLKADLKYYVEDAEQDEDVKKKLETIKYKNVNPEEIKVIEPCCGSGHILVYVFDLIYKMYLEKGYNSKDIPSLILKNNLYGLDVDKRAAQLANFSLVMKARSIDNRFFIKNRFVSPNVYEIKDSQILFASNYESAMESLHFSKTAIEQAKTLQHLFSNGKVIGSLLKVDTGDYALLSREIDKCLEKETPGLFEQDFYQYGITNLKQLIRLAEVMSSKYDVMITNPPYLLTAKMDEPIKKYYVKNYPNSKDDLSVMFMETALVKKNGFCAVVNPDGWMFISSFIKVRNEIIKSKMIINAMHIEMGAFEAVVKTTSFIMRYASLKEFNYKTTKCSESSAFGKVIYLKQIQQYEKVPLQRFSYWINDTVLESFKSDNMSKFIDAKAGMVTGDAERFLRFWWEVEFNKIGFNNKKLKWIPYQKGGNFKRWYGNNEYVVNWENDGYEMKNDNSDEKGRIRSHNYNGDWGFRRALSWTEFSSSDFSCRIVNDGFLFDSSGPMCYVFDKNNELNVLALFNSKVANYYFNLFNPTVHYLPSNLLEMPSISDAIFDKEIAELAKENVDIAKFDWDKNETSWDFKTHFLIRNDRKISDAYKSFSVVENDYLDKQKRNEIKLNKIFINLYGLNEILNEDISFEKITYKPISSKDAVKGLISYLIGCMMGRYSLSCNSHLYEKTDKCQSNDYIDEDAILPIYKFVGIDSGLTSEVCKMIKHIYGDTYYKENLDFIAQSLGRKADEGPEETINRYLNEDFYNDHLRIYQKRPIYWMFSSGKQGAFKCLIYMHRYNKNTLALINSKYFLPRTAMYKAEAERIEAKLKTTTDNKQRKELEKESQSIDSCQQELMEYGQVLDHMANQYIDINLDDGVKTNYCKFQGISLEVNGATIKKDLLVEFGLNDKKKKGME